MSNNLIQALILKYKGEVLVAKANIKTFIDNPNGVADHPDIMDTIEKELDEISKYNDLLEVLDKYFSNDAKNIQKKQILNDYDYLTNA